jgi:hypothetical protein
LPAASASPRRSSMNAVVVGFSVASAAVLGI